MTEVNPENILSELPPTAPEWRERALQLIAALADSLSEAEFNTLIEKIKAAGVDPVDYLFRFYLLAKAEETKKKAAQNAINLLKDYGDEAVREQYGQGVLDLLREIQATPPDRIKDEKLLAFYDTLKSAEEHIRIMGETPDLPLNLPKVKPALPNHVMQSISRITKESKNIPTNGNARAFSVDRDNKIEVRAALTLPKKAPENIRFSNGWKLDDFGLSIQDAIATLEEYGTKKKVKIDGKEYNCFTENEIAILLGATGDTHGNIKQNIREEIRTQMQTMCYVDWSEQLEDMKRHAQKNPELLKKLNDIKDPSEEAILLPLRKQMIKVKGNELIQYVIMRLPYIPEYSKRAGEQRILMPLNALSVPGLNFTIENHSIIRYLARYVAISRHEKAPQNIRLETVLKHIEKENAPSRDKKRIAERINKILENYKNTEFIKDFSLILGERGNTTGWTIET